MPDALAQALRESPPLPATVRRELQLIATRAGLTGSAQGDLVRVMRWHLGLGRKPVPVGAVTPASQHTQEVIRRRAHELVHAYAKRLPFIEHDAMLTS